MCIRDRGYTTEKVTVTDKSGKEISVKDNGDGTYSFVKPEGRTTVRAVFQNVFGASTSGSCGENVRWELNNGTLTISGSGSMESVSYTHLGGQNLRYDGCSADGEGESAGRGSGKKDRRAGIEGGRDTSFSAHESRKDGAAHF